VTIDLFTIVLAVAGSMVGSFLNVVIYRVPRGESIVSPPSRCPSCARELRFFENVPIVGWIALGGRCRTCHARIPIRYPIVEAATAALFVLHYSVFGLEPLFYVRLAFACLMLALFFIDLDHHLLPNVITLPGLVAGLVASLFVPPGWRDALIGAVFGGGILLLMFYAWLWVRREEALGMGDVKMLAMIGAFLGWRLALVTLVLSSLVGSLVGVMVILTGRGGLKSQLPYGTFLALAAIVASLAGDALLTWYAGFYQ
jgi:leader peptidase (prepilin peptidase)/N-methyltransferase